MAQTKNSRPPYRVLKPWVIALIVVGCALFTMGMIFLSLFLSEQELFAKKKQKTGYYMLVEKNSVVERQYEWVFSLKSYEDRARHLSSISSYDGSMLFLINDRARFNDTSFCALDAARASILMKKNGRECAAPECYCPGAEFMSGGGAYYVSECDDCRRLGNGDVVALFRGRAEEGTARVRGTLQLVPGDLRLHYDLRVSESGEIKLY